MTSSSPFAVIWSETASLLLGEVSDRRIRQKIYEIAGRLSADPQQQGKPLRDDLIGFRSLRMVGQRYRIIYSVEEERRQVQVWAAGLRKEGEKEDIYRLAQRLLRLDLIVSPVRRRRKKK